MQTFSSALAAQCRAGDVIALTGDLGAGKTTFARGFIRQLCDAPEVASPTFMLVQHYPARAGGAVSHFDLYRLTRTSELLEIGFEEALAHDITLIEWPQLAAAILPGHTLHVRIDFTQGGAGRTLNICGDVGWKARLATLAKSPYIMGS